MSADFDPTALDRKKRDDGGPAFPVLNDRTENFRLLHASSGMSLRDHFAGQALGGILAAVASNGPTHYSALAREAYLFADAMLIERAIPEGTS